MKLGLYIVAVTVTLLGSLSVAPVIFAHFLPSPPALFSDNRRYAPPEMINPMSDRASLETRQR
jgi:hypothetical protein